MQTEIFIAGAGLAGLSLATSLQKRGVEFQLAEARERIGGRILSHDFGDNNKLAAVADLGPSWVWPGQALIAALLSELDIGVFEQYSRGRLVYEDELGQVRRDLDYSSMGGSLRIDGGIARVTAALAARLREEVIHLSHRVCAVHETGEGYLVDLVHPGGNLQVAARKVVFAMPPRLIANLVEFEPALPETLMQEMRSIPTWMAGHAKLFAFFEEPFWRAQGLSGDGISRCGPLMEIHDACAASPGPGALFGFVGLAAGSAKREPDRLKSDAIAQLEKMYGPDAANPLDIILQDWATEEFTATETDQITSQHPAYGLRPGMAALADKGLLFASTEMAPQFGGFIEGALEASRDALKQL